MSVLFSISLNGKMMANNISTLFASKGIEASHPIKRQIYDTSVWFVRLRWFAIAIILAAGFIAQPLGFNVSLGAVAAIAGYLLFANVVLWLVARKYLNPYVTGLRLNIFTNVQIWIDWLAVLAIMHYTGGITSPAVYYFCLHLVMAGILLPARHIYINTVIVVALMAGLLWAEVNGILGTHSLMASVEPLQTKENMPYVFGVFVLMSSAFFIIIFLTSQAAELLRRRMRQLHVAKTSLEEATGRLEAMYEVMRLVGVKPDVETLLNEMVKQATSLMEIRAAFIALYDNKARGFILAASHGLDTKTSPEVLSCFSEPPLGTRLRVGEEETINDIEQYANKNDLPMMWWLYSQELRSFMMVPLKIEGKTIGGFCLASTLKNRFSETDQKYFRFFSDLSAIEIEKAQATQMLRSHNQTRSWFYRKAAHDLRSPLAAIRSMLDLVDQGYVDDQQKMKELVHRATKRAAQLSDMINELLILAEDRMEALAPEVEEVDMKRLTFAAVETFESAASEKGIRLVYAIDDDVAPVRATKEGMERVIQNLVSNAIKYTPNNGKVKISLMELPFHFIRIIVEDSGIGISEDEKDKIFNEFYRASNAKKINEVGTGLGLSITKKTVETFDGTIEMETELGEGSKFCVIMPSIKSPDTRIMKNF